MTEITEIMALDESAEGYMDGRDKDAVQPGPNRSPFYRHGFDLALAELANNPIPAHISRRKWDAMLQAAGDA